MLGLAIVSGAAWLLLLLRARHGLESGKPPSHPGSHSSRGWVAASNVAGCVFGGGIGASFGGIVEAVTFGVLMGALTQFMVPRQKQLKADRKRRRRIEGPDRARRSGGQKPPP